MNYSFNLPSDNGTGFYLIPLPLDLPLGINMRWVSDVVQLAPSCEWLVPAMPQLPSNDLDGSYPMPPSTGVTVDAKILSHDLQVNLDTADSKMQI